MFNNYEYNVEQTTRHRLMWCCTQKYKTKCRARVATFKNRFYLTIAVHNHGPTVKKRATYVGQIMEYGGDPGSKKAIEVSIEDSE
ncbi:unnamed protein product [Acanthoscelides obtectus]|uniref:FLYWCH-type domain-containing protein n=1 Tax=Acanthoscelides obtectus TaxID=200917 RepID=A0A9P0MFH5_ACAOB|nr:unnamed protein product [Acanthoscelides obtectus]CAK1676571.1 hypothetical protein AOBTE_LOCUS30827 [Acanthoscelides obtectus]